MHIFWSGGFDWQMNAFMYDLTQKQCLDHLLITDLQTLAEIVDHPKPSKSIGCDEHFEPVIIQGSTYTKRTIVRYLSELIDPDSMSLAADATDNPMMPCSLLKAYKSAANIYIIWTSMRDGELPVPNANTFILGESVDILKTGSIPTQKPLVAARITAGYFVNQIFFTREKDSQFIRQSSQAECLNEFISPSY